jgi:hypothetical protein
MLSIAGFQVVARLKQSQPRLWFWQRPRCAQCAGRLEKCSFDIPRHLARELIELRLLPGEAEAVFHSTRDDLGWRIRGWVCKTCKTIEPIDLKHSR